MHRAYQFSPFPGIPREGPSQHPRVHVEKRVRKKSWFCWVRLNSKNLKERDATRPVA